MSDTYTFKSTLNTSQTVEFNDITRGAKIAKSFDIMPTDATTVLQVVKTPDPAIPSTLNLKSFIDSFGTVGASFDTVYLLIFANNASDAGAVNFGITADIDMANMSAGEVIIKYFPDGKAIDGTNHYNFYGSGGDVSIYAFGK